MAHFFVYIVQCSDGSFYTGWTVNLEQRLKAHNQGTASKYTRGRLPVAYVYQETLASKREAQKREAALKKLSRKEKERLILGQK